MKNIVIAGNITRDAVVRQGGQSNVTGWSVAVDDGWGDKKTTIFFDCSWWGQRGEKVAPYLLKGGKVAVSGELSKREHEGKTYLTVNVSDVTLQGGKPQSQSGGTYDNQAPAPELDSEIPF